MFSYTFYMYIYMLGPRFTRASAFFAPRFTRVSAFFCALCLRLYKGPSALSALGALDNIMWKVV